VIRLAPIALYTSYSDVWQLVQHLRAIIDNSEQEAFAATRDLVA
jgi:kynureninase